MFASPCKFEQRLPFTLYSDLLLLLLPNIVEVFIALQVHNRHIYLVT